MILRGLFLIVASLWALAAASQLEAATLLSRQPYVQAVRQTQVTLMWRTATAAQQTIEYSIDESYALSLTEPGPTTHHELTLTGLQPGAVYNYRVRDDGVVVASNPLYTFRTDAGRQDDEFSFFVTGDIGVELGDNGFQAVTQQRIRNTIPYPDFGLLPGDIIYPDGASERYDSQLMAPWADLLCNTPVYPALGNHDWRVDPEQNFVREWCLPNNEHYYSFDYGNAHIIALDTADEYFYDEANQLLWLQQDLATPRSTQWTFVFYHHPLLTCTYKGDLPGMADAVMPLFEQYGVDIVFTGHAHTYERLFPIVNGAPVDQQQDPYYIDPSGPIYVVSGCGGKIKTGEPTSFCGPTADFVDETYAFTQVIVQNNTLALLPRSSLTGEILDLMTITKTIPTTDIEIVPPTHVLRQNFPNPFNPATTIPFELARQSKVHLQVYGADGTWVTSLARRVYPAGNHQVRWNGLDHAGRPVSSGIYVVKLRSDERFESLKMMLVR